MISDTVNKCLLRLRYNDFWGNMGDTIMSPIFVQTAEKLFPKLFDVLRSICAGASGIVFMSIASHS